MPTFTDLPDDFCCPHRDGCPYLEGLSTRRVFDRYNAAAGLECQYEHQIHELYRQIDQKDRCIQNKDLEIARLNAQLAALHRRQFKGRGWPHPPPLDDTASKPKKRGAPAGHPPWQRPKPKRIDRIVPVPAPEVCARCNQPLQPVEQVHEHLQEDIVLEPRTVVTRFVHQQGYCAHCGKNLWSLGPGEMPGAYVGPAAKATAVYMRYELNVPERKISRFFNDFFGLKFVPASACGFERQATRRGRPLYEDLRQKIRSLPVVHGDETSWRNDGQAHWAWYAGNADLAFFHLDRHRTGEAAQTLLGERFEGTLVADAYASYNCVHPRHRQSCLAHLKTKAKELQQELALLKGPAADPAAIRFCQKIQGWVKDVCQAHQKLCRGRWNAKTSRLKGRQLRQKLQALCRKKHRHPKAEAFRQRLTGQEQSLFFTCFNRPNVPPTNNHAERSLRPLVIMRKVIHGTRSRKGMENHSVLRSLFETARRQGKKPHQFFLSLLTQSTTQAHAALYRKPLPSKPNPPLRC